MSSTSFNACLPSFERDLAADVDELRIEARDRTGRGVHHHERVDTRRLAQRNPPHDHPAHGVTQEPEVLEPGRLGDRQGVGTEPGQRVRRGIGRVVARAMTAMVEDHDTVITRERRHVIGEVLLRAAEAVHQQQARSVARNLHLEPNTVIGRDAHAHMLTRIGSLAPPQPPSRARIAPTAARRLTGMPGDPAVVRRSGAGWKVALRLLVSAAFLAVLITRVPDLGESIPSDHGLRTALFLIAAVVMMFVGIVLSAWRWQQVLLVFDAPVPLRTLTGHYLAGQFVGNVLPSTIGGDVLRVARCAKTIGSATTSFASVVLERLSGMIALPLLVVVGFAVRPSLFHVAARLVRAPRIGDHGRGVGD